MLDVRLAQPDDAEAINRILQETWKVSLLFDVFTDHISSPVHKVLVAVKDGEVAGFLSAFLVSKPMLQWEIDLIVVYATSQGKGIGTKLIKEALTYGSNLGAYRAKASIRVDNHASQRAFCKAGFTTDTQVLNLLLWYPLACEPVSYVPETVSLIPVDTFIYRGLWIEGFVESQLSVEEQHSVIHAAQSRIFHEDRSDTGMFIPESLKHTITPDLLDSSADHGQYQHWYYIFKKENGC
ncbi:GNAT family N-acetyltransferase [Candidatus Poribacteria bacterium]|nr:GNAT family N-acetyltransferase [Candidatus Poribacteria bacterium]